MNRITSIHKGLLALLLALFVGSSLAQDLTAEQILDNMKQEAESLSDASFLVTGRLVDADGTSLNLEIDVEVMPDEEVARATFYQPDALADNVIIFDGEAIYNYIFLTNQVTVFDANDPDALGGLLSGGGEGGNLTLTLDLEALFAGWDVTVEGYDAGSYQLRFSNIDPAASLQTVFVKVSDSTWAPEELRLLGSEDRLVAELFIEEFSPNSGLTREDVTYIPEDAEVIDERG